MPFVPVRAGHFSMPLPAFFGNYKRGTRLTWHIARCDCTPCSVRRQANALGIPIPSRLSPSEWSRFCRPDRRIALSSSRGLFHRQHARATFCHMAKENPINDFGLLIAYVLPGFVALWGVSVLDPSVNFFILDTGENQPTVAGFFFSTIAAIVAGLIVSTVRWLTIDPLHRLMGVQHPDWDAALLEQNINAFNVLIEGHYRFYLWYANTTIAVLWVFIARRIAIGGGWTVGGWDAGLLAVTPLLFMGSRDTLTKYYARVGRLLTGNRNKEPRRRRAARSKLVVANDQFKTLALPSAP